jgi:quercetin dioxygenase-like cupin family protein
MVPITGRARSSEAIISRVESKTAASDGPTQPRDVRTVTESISREIYNPVQRDRVVFVKTSSETGGEVTLADMEVAPGGGNPLHFHTSFSERFLVEEGEFGAQIARRRLVLHAGESETVRPRVAHRWFNASDRPVRVRLELRPGNEGFERALRIIYGLATDGLTNSSGIPKNLLHLAVLAEMGDTRLAGLTRPLNLLFGLLARVAHRRGVDAELSRRYGV